jgi:putative tryptophan/tyrosine transport system substrate-binding protein
MIRRQFLGATAALLASSAVRGQALRTARVAWTNVEAPNPGSPFLSSFRGAMKATGWIEGGNLALDTWWGGGSTDGLMKRVPEIVASRPDVILTAGGPATRVFINAGVSLPVVFTSSADAVIGKIVETWARPGVNRTGVSFFALELIPKRVELMREMVPSLKRLAIIGWPPHAGEMLEREAAENAAERHGLQHRYFGANTQAELENVLPEVAGWRPEAALVFAGLLTSYSPRFAAFSQQTRIPVASSWAIFAEQGNVMTYGPVLEQCYARLAYFVDRILKGAKASELPVERPTKFELIINLKAAKTIGLAIPQSILLRADRVIA